MELQLAPETQLLGVRTQGNHEAVLQEPDETNLSSFLSWSLTHLPNPSTGPLAESAGVSRSSGSCIC